MAARSPTTSLSASALEAMQVLAVLLGALALPTLAALPVSARGYDPATTTTAPTTTNVFYVGASIPVGAALNEEALPRCQDPEQMAKGHWRYTNSVNSIELGSSSSSISSGDYQVHRPQYPNWRVQEKYWPGWPRIQGDIEDHVPYICRPQTAFLTDTAREDACLAQVDTARKYKWSPSSCSLDRFEPRAFMESVRNRRIVFAGDSLVDNSYTSLQCQLLAFLSEISDKQPFNGDWQQPWWSAYSKEYNTSFVFVRDEWLLAREHFDNENEEGPKTKLIEPYQLIPVFEDTLQHADLLWLGTGAHWHLNGLYVEAGYTMEASLEQYKTALQWMLQHILSTQPQIYVLLADVLPYHKDCNEYTLPTQHVPQGLFTQGEFQIEQSKIVADITKSTAVYAQQLFTPRNVPTNRLLHIPTRAVIEDRPDGHPGTTQENITQRFRDCLHFCLPGPSEEWNSLLLTTIKQILRW